MISKIKKELQKRNKDNRGAALVMVIITIAFVGMLVAMVLYMAYCNYLMKASDIQAKDNFYSAEYAMDVLNAGLQLDISECMSEAYVRTMNNSAGKDAEIMELEFKEEFLEKLTAKLQDTTGGVADPNKWNIHHLKNFWVRNNLTVASVPGVEGAYIESIDGRYRMETSTNSDYITMYDLKIVYTDAKGFVSIITTDIRLKVPTIGFAQSATRMNIENFSLIANDSLVNDNNSTDPRPSGVSIGSEARITGNVFGGYDGVLVANQKQLRFEQDPADVGAATPIKYNLIADSLNVSNALSGGAGLYVDDSFVTYVNDISVQSARVDLDGTIYAGDDLDIGGKNSDVTVRGEYIGYGNVLGKADGSSSILINGGNTTLDFSDLNKLTLSGHAYVGAKKYDADVDRLAYASNESNKENLTSDKIEDEDEYSDRLDDEESTYKDTENSIPKNEMDFMMGESISVKANQLLYLVPSECVGFKVSTGEQVIAKNPMTYEEYQKLTETEEPKLDENGAEVVVNGETVMQKVYDPVRLDKLWAKLGGVAYTNDYKAVYRRVNGTVLVYLYLDFGVSETMANAFYKAYYEYDKAGIDSYVNSYLADMRWNAGLTSNLTLAGNAFRVNGNGEVQFIENQLNDPNKYANMLTWQTEYSNNHEAMMHSLSTDFDAMTSTQQSSQIFDSLVDENKFASMSGKVFTDETGNIQARISDGSVVYPSTGCPADTKLIVAKENIYITDDFKGLAIAGGNIYICNGCYDINYSPSEVLQAMRTKATVGGKEIYAYEIFGANGSISYANGGDEIEEEKVELRDLIMYQDWKKE